MSALDAIAGPVVPLVPETGDASAAESLRRLPEAEGKKRAASELETLFMTQLLRAMRKTIPENDFLPKSPARKTYEDAFDETVARTLAQGDPLGMVKRIGSDPIVPPRGPQVPGRTGR